jgi:hypothetical protein
VELKVERDDVVRITELDVDVAVWLLELEDWVGLELLVDDWLLDVDCTDVELDVEVGVWLLDVCTELEVLEDTDDEDEEDTLDELVLVVAGPELVEVDETPTKLLEEPVKELELVGTDVDTDADELDERELLVDTVTKVDVEDTELVVVLPIDDELDTRPVRFWYNVKPFPPPQISPVLPYTITLAWLLIHIFEKIKITYPTKHIAPSIRGNVAPEAQRVSAIALLHILEPEVCIASAVSGAVLDGHIFGAEILALQSANCGVVAVAVKICVRSYRGENRWRRGAWCWGWWDWSY